MTTDDTDIHFHLGRQHDCASCRKKFTAARRPARAVRLFPNVEIPFCAEYLICRACGHLLEGKGESVESAMTAIWHYHRGEEARN